MASMRASMGAEDYQMITKESVKYDIYCNISPRDDITRTALHTNTSHFNSVCLWLIPVRFKFIITLT